MHSVLGDLPDRHREISVRKVDEEEREHYVLEELVLDLNGIERVPAYFTRSIAREGRFPTVLCNHAHGGDYVLGKDEMLKGRDALQQPPYAEVLAREGYAAAGAPDAWKLLRYETGHFETDDMRSQILRCLRKWL